MKKIVIFNCYIVLFFLLFLSSVTPAYSKQDTFNVYLSGKTGYSGIITTLSDRSSSHQKSGLFSSFLVGGSFGGQYYFKDPFGLRIELEYIFRTKDSITTARPQSYTTSLFAHTIFTNVYLDWYLNQHIALYTQAGVGISMLHLTYEGPSSGASSSQTDFVWHAGLGLSYALTEHVFFDIGVRYVGYVHPDIGPIHLKNLDGIDAMISCRYLF